MNKVLPEGGPPQEAVLDESATVPLTAKASPKQSPQRINRGATIRMVHEDSHEEGWQPPSRERAQAHRRKKMFKHGDASVRRTTELQIGGELGDGMQLYFTYLRYLTFAFAAMSVLSVPALVIHYAGHGIDEQEVDGLGLSLLSLGNEGVNPANIKFGDCLEDGGKIDCNGTTVDLYGNQVLATDISAGLTCIDIACMAVFMFMTYKFYHRLRGVRLEVDASTISASDYTVYVEGLPHNVTMEEVLHHFDTRYNLAELQKSYPLVCGFAGRGRQRYPPGLTYELRHSQALWRTYRRKRGHMTWNPAVIIPETETGKRPIHHTPVSTDIAPNPACLGSWVADVHFARPFGDQLRFFKNRKAQAIKMRTLESHVKMHSPGSAVEGGPDPAKRAKYDKKLQKLKHKSQKASPPIDPAHVNDCYGAFVVFAHMESARRCLDDYRSSGSLMGHLFQPTSLRFHRTSANGQDHYWPLKVTKAANPTDVLWENLDTPVKSHRARRWLTGIVMLALLVLSFLIANEAANRQRELEKLTPTVAFCTSELAPVHFGSYYNNTPIDADLVWMPEAECASETAVEISFEGGYAADALPPLFTPSLQRRDRATDVPADVNLCDHSCHEVNSAEPCHTLACAVPEWQDSENGGWDCVEYRESFHVSCYCIQALEGLIASDGLIDGAQRLIDEQGAACETYVETFIEAKMLIIFAALVVLGVNAALKGILKGLTKFERHISTSKEARETVRKLTFALLLNTAIVAMLVNASLPNNVESPTKGTGILEGEHSDFTRGWYSTVGVSITLTMILNTVAPHGGPVAKLALKYALLRLKQKSASSQQELNELYEPQPFDVSVRLPFTFVVMIVTVLFSAGMPILLPIATASVAISYWLDKFLLLKFYARPPRYSHTMMVSAVRFAPLAIVGHAALTMWMFGNNEILKSDIIDVNLISPTEVDTSDEEAVQAAYDAFLDRVEDSDPLGREGIAAKVVRTNVFPMFLFLVASIAFWVIHKVMGNLVITFLSALWKDFLYYCFGKRAQQDPDEAIAVAQVGFCDAYEQRIPRNLARKYKLTKAEEAMGRRVAPLDNGEKAVWQVWTEEGEAHGIWHDANQFKRTWEAILDNGLETYDIQANPEYYYAVRDLLRAFARQQGRGSVVGGMSLDVKSPNDNLRVLDVDVDQDGNETPSTHGRGVGGGVGRVAGPPAGP